MTTGQNFSSLAMTGAGTLTVRRCKPRQLPPFRLRNRLHPQFLGFSRFRPGIGTDHHEVGLLRDAVGDFRAQSLRARLGFRPGHGFQRAGEHDRFAGDLTVGCLRSPRRARPSVARPVRPTSRHCAVHRRNPPVPRRSPARCRTISPSVLRASEPMTVAAIMPARHSCERTIMPRQQSRIGLADPADAKRVDQPLQRNAPPRLDRAGQIAGGESCPSLRGPRSPPRVPAAETNPPGCAASRLRKTRGSISRRDRRCRTRRGRRNESAVRHVAAGQIRPPVQRRTTSPGGRTA